MDEKLIKIIQRNSHITNKELAVRLNTTETEIEKILQKLESEKLILGYTTIINENHPTREKNQAVRAIIELKISPQRDGGYNRIAERISKFEEVSNVYLMSGGYDLSVQVDGESLQEVASFVTSKLSTIEGVLSCATHFILKKYKEAGYCFNTEDVYERLKITP